MGLQVFGNFLAASFPTENLRGRSIDYDMLLTALGLLYRFLCVHTFTLKKEADGMQVFGNFLAANFPAENLRGRSIDYDILLTALGCYIAFYV